jgi:hypothetical protein
MDAAFRINLMELNSGMPVELSFPHKDLPLISLTLLSSSRRGYAARRAG